MRDKILIISNESISKKNDNYYCDNLDIKSIPKDLTKRGDVILIGRLSKDERYHKIEKSYVYPAPNFFSFIKQVYLEIKKNKNLKILIISITPFTFLASLIVFTFKNKPFVYLRSDGFEEYKSIFGLLGPIIYQVMFSIIAKTSKLISCRKHILKSNDGKIVSPSHLTEKWFENTKPVSINKVDLLYVGRIKVEKGIFSFLKIFEDIENKFSLTIVSPQKMHKDVKNRNNIKLIDSRNEDDLIKIYDQSNIFILPSYTEGHPQVLDEALARLRPVIVFEEISHVKRDRSGVFICKRNKASLIEKINYILKNYETIQNEIKKNINNLPTRIKFIKELENIIF
ncbi:MAG: hypothetical protein CMF96_12080 [Candidatus Marinimicrobia bacterium]|nr:hypothetical protein [Candidatus Neomarinimicrobiota bacterium]